MPCVPRKKIKNKINYTVSTPRHEKKVSQRALYKHKNSSLYKGPKWLTEEELRDQNKTKK